MDVNLQSMQVNIKLALPLQAHAKTNLIYLAQTDEASKSQFIQINGM